MDPKRMRVSPYPTKMADLYAEVTAEHPNYNPVEVLSEVFRQMSLAYKEATYIIAAILKEQPGRMMTIRATTIATLPRHAVIRRSDHIDGVMMFELVEEGR